MTNEKYNELSKEIVDACYQVHKELGPELLASAYEYALLVEFDTSGIKVIHQHQIPLFYKGYNTGKHYIIDMLIEDEIILELKCVEIMHPVYIAQIISYLKLSNKKLGFLVNFKVPVLKEGIKRYVNKF